MDNRGIADLLHTLKNVLAFGTEAYDVEGLIEDIDEARESLGVDTSDDLIK